MKTETISDEDPMKRAINRIFGKLDPDEFFCPARTGAHSMITVLDCELKGRGSGCSDIPFCKAYQAQKKKNRELKEGGI